MMAGDLYYSTARLNNEAATSMTLMILNEAPYGSERSYNVSAQPIHL